MTITASPLQHHRTRTLQLCCETTALEYSFYSTLVHPLHAVVEYCSYEHCTRSTDSTMPRLQQYSTIPQPYSIIHTALPLQHYGSRGLRLYSNAT
eukprot:1353315-Pyramimonas_sp.AAC.1